MLIFLFALLSPVLLLTTKVDADADADANFQSGLVKNPTGEKSGLGNETNEDSDLESWEAPYWIRKNYPYYLSGYDLEGRPVWACEFGRWDVRKIVDSGIETEQIFEKYHKQFFHRVQKSISKSKDGVLPEGLTSGEEKQQPLSWVFIMDMADFNVRQLRSPKAVAFFLKLMKIVDLNAKNMEHGFCVNVDFVAHSFLNLMRPVLGQTLQKVEIFGTVQSKWVTNILRAIPQASLPVFYGGSKSHKPLAVYG